MSTAAALAPHMAIANTIAAQMGGAQRLARFIGAKHIMAHGQSEHGPGGLSFKIASDLQAKDGINYVKITLTPSGLYRIEFGRIPSRFEYEIVKVIDGLYYDMLVTTFERETGLFLHL